LKVPKPNHRNLNQAYLEKQEERENWHKIVVKILSWKGGKTNSGSSILKDKISLKEWNTYYQGMIKISVVSGKENTVKKLEEIKKLIKSHGGFQD
jgi:hypothetical protein